MKIFNKRKPRREAEKNAEQNLKTVVENLKVFLTANEPYVTKLERSYGYDNKTADAGTILKYTDASDGSGYSSLADIPALINDKVIQKYSELVNNFEQAQRELTRAERNNQSCRIS